jgi:trehalose 6-phosphate synthase
LPARDEVLRGFLGADLVGFQDRLSADNFVRAAARLDDAKADATMITVDEHRTAVGVYPVSVDVPAIEHLVRQDHIRARARQMRDDFGAPETLFVSSDRLDYTKGIADRLRVYGELLRDGRLSAATTAFVQIATPSRENLAEYARIRERIERLAGQLNGTYGRVGKPVVHYSPHTYTFEEMVSLFSVADVMVVTPFRDGMNLIAKEYVASRTDNRGALVLSEFAGAAIELSESLVVNPYDEQSMKTALVRAATMTGAEQGRRMHSMRRHLAENDIHAWLASLNTDLLAFAGRTSAADLG